jgi:hypothetical protein
LFALGCGVCLSESNNVEYRCMDEYQDGLGQGVPPEDPEEPMGQVRIWRFCDYQSKSGRKIGT